MAYAHFGLNTLPWVVGMACGLQGPRPELRWGNRLLGSLAVTDSSLKELDWFTEITEITETTETTEMAHMALATSAAVLCIPRGGRGGVIQAGGNPHSHHKTIL